MGLSAAARDRLADLVELQPTTNGELADRWGLDGGSAVHGYLEEHLADYYARNDDGYIVATDAAAGQVDVTPTVQPTDDGVVIGNDPLLRAVAAALPAPDERAKSVVAVLQSVRDDETEAEVDAVRDAIKSLNRAGVVDPVQRTVPTYKLAVPRDQVQFAD